MTVDGIVYDLDGTLVDSAADIARAANGVRARFGLSALAVDRVIPFIGDGAGKLLERAVFGRVDDPRRRPDDVLEEAAATVEELLDDFRRAYSEDPVRETALLPGVADALAYWKDRGTRLGVLTNKPHDITERVLAALDVDRFFDVVVGRGATDQRGRPIPAKPERGALDHVLERMNVDAPGAWMVGDGVPDVRVARAAGVRCLVLMDGFTEAAALRAEMDETAREFPSFATADAFLRAQI